MLTHSGIVTRMMNTDTTTAPRIITLADGATFEVQIRNGEDVIWLACGRCSGQGRIQAFGHVYGGECFECRGSGGRFITVAKAVRNAKQRVARRAKATREAELERARATAGLDAFRAAHSALAFLADDLTAVNVWTNGHSSGHPILLDLSAKLHRYGSLSEAQISLAARIVAEQAEREAAKAATPPAPAGRMVVEGKVIKLNSFEGDFGWVHKMIVVTDAGWRVNVTVPRDIAEVEKGQRVRFTATLAPAEDDPTFAKGTRPVKAEILAD